MKKERISGDLDVARDITGGGNLSVRGNAGISGNLYVDGWFEGRNVRVPCKGLYASEADLKEAYPRPRAGWYALVGNTLPAPVWRAALGQWLATGEVGGNMELAVNVYDTQLATLSERITSLEDKSDEINSPMLDERITALEAERVPMFDAIVSTSAAITAAGVYWVNSSNNFFEIKANGEQGDPQIASGVLRCKADGRLYEYDSDRGRLNRLIARPEAIATHGVFNVPQSGYDEGYSTVLDWAQEIMPEERLHGAVLTFPVQTLLTIAPHWESWQYVGSWASGQERVPITDEAWMTAANWVKIWTTHQTVGGIVSNSGESGSGIVSNSGESGSGIVSSAGEYALRVTSAGIEASRDGGSSWETIFQ